MQNNLMMFEGNQVEIFEFGGQVLFNPYDVGKCLDLTESAVRKAIGNMNEKQVIKLTQSIVKDFHNLDIPTAGKLFLTESGVYKLIFRSNKPNAEKFTDWVTDEVLPSIRKTGSYSHTPKTYLEALEQLVEKVKQNEILQLENKAKDQQIAELKPKATYYDFILQCKDAVSISKISKDYGMSAIAMNRLLNELGVQYKQGDMWLLYYKYQDKGYTQSKTHNYDRGDGTQGVAMSTYWTQKGRLFIYDLLKNSGVTPLIERDAVCA